MGFDGNGEVDKNGQPSDWKFLPTEALITVFEYLNFQDLCRCSQVCKQWNDISSLNCLWKRLFSTDFCVQVDRVNSVISYKEEYERLTDSVPSVEWKCIKDHCDEVLHVSFSHDGTMFCSCSKDATFKVFNADWPFQRIFSEDMGHNTLFRLSYTQFSQFNIDDSELLVSGRHDGYETGEIFIYGIYADEFSLQARIRMQPYDVMGVWLNESHVLSSRCHRLSLGHRYLSEILLNKSSQEVHNIRKSIVNRLHVFENEHMYAVSYLKVADMTKVMSKLYQSVASGNFNGVVHSMHLRVLLQREEHAKNLFDSIGLQKTEARPLLTTSQVQTPSVEESNSDGLPPPEAKQLLLDKKATEKPRLVSDSNLATGTAMTADVGNKKCSLDSSTDQSNCRPDISPGTYKLLLAFTGVIGNNKIAMKYITKEKCDDVRPINIEQELTRINGRRSDDDSVQRSIPTDQWDNVIDVAGQLIGMEVSPCGRYLYASFRKFRETRLSEPLFPPPICSTVTISVFDLISMNEVMVLNGPSAVSSVFYLYLSCAGEYLASGSEDNQGYLWNSRYACIVSNFKHDDVVNCVSISPCDTSMAVSVSDDHTIKIWRSKSFLRSLAGK